jgi:hypothetical protein
MYNLNARFYDAKLARFMQEDTYLGSQGDPLSLNLYSYCSNNPLIYYDLTGHNANVQSAYNAYLGGYISGAEYAAYASKQLGIVIDDPSKGKATTNTVNTGGGNTNNNTGTANKNVSNNTGGGGSGGGGNGGLLGVNFGPNESADWLRTGSGLSFEEFWGVTPGGTDYYTGLTNVGNIKDPTNAGVWYQGTFTKQSDIIIATISSGEQFILTPHAQIPLIQFEMMLPAIHGPNPGPLALDGYANILVYNSSDLAAIAFANENVIPSAKDDLEYYSYIYKMEIYGRIYYRFTAPDKLNRGGGHPKEPSAFGIKSSDVVAVIHTHAKPIGWTGENRFSFGMDTQLNRSLSDETFGIGEQYSGLYLAAPNGTLQFLPAREPVSDHLIKVISYETPVAEGALTYTTGSEQIYVAVTKVNPWYKRLLGAPKEYIIYERKSEYVEIP